MDEPDRLQRRFLIMPIVSFAVMMLAIIGEVVAWWERAGEITISLAAYAGLLATVLTLLRGPTKRHVRGIAIGVGTANQRPELVRGTLGPMDSSLSSMDRKLDRLDVVTDQSNHQTGILVQIRDRL